MQLRIMSLNMNTAHGPVLQLEDQMRKRAVRTNLDRIARTIQNHDPDVVCLQEVDIDWKGTGRINQAKYLSKKTALPHFYYHAHHASIIPKILRPFFGTRLLLNRELGTAILSRYPLLKCDYFNFGEDLSNDPKLKRLLRLLNESKGFTSVIIDPSRTNGSQIGIVNVHLQSDVFYNIFKWLGIEILRGEATIRIRQTERLIELLRDRLAYENIPYIVAGDFNSPPRESAQLHFAECHIRDRDDYRRDMTLYLIRESGLLKTIPPLSGSGDPSKILQYHTYPATQADRTLDYIFATKQFSFLTYHVLPDQISDHLAVLADLEL